MSAPTKDPPEAVSADDRDEYLRHAFLVQSHSAFCQNLPPTFDTAVNPRQKRRRTSPHDHAILEAAYLNNSKPDKTERADIVDRVTLGEKEVQIWFQNRRQNDRRRSRPLLPHELVPHFRNDVPKGILLQSRLGNEDAVSSKAFGIEDPALERPASAQSFHSHVSIYDLLNPSSSSEDQVTSSSDKGQPGAAVMQGTPPSTLELPEAVQTPESCSPGNLSLASSQSVGQTGSGRKRTYEEISDAGNRETDAIQRSPAETAIKGSQIRLSMTADGAMKIRTGLEDTPSPPKERALPPVARVSKGLQRSKSAIDVGLLSASATRESSTPPMIGRNFGRSRDARTWEFYCDSNARDTLSAHAETERSGSAVGAINLIRSQSQKSRKQALTPQPIKVNPRVSALGQSLGKPKLSRAKSSMGRLQGSNLDMNMKAAKSHKPGLVRSPSGDSDKENWAPGTQQSTNPLRRTHPSAMRRDILQDNEMAIGRRQIQAVAKLQQGTQRSVDLGTNSLYARRVSIEKEKDKGEDLDCVQGLLSLSQGAWR